MPPQNIEAERAVLGSMLIAQEAVIDCIDILSADAFYRTAHKNIFAVIKNLFAENEAVDIVTVSEKLKQKKELKSIGGFDYLSRLVDEVVSAANVTYYAKIVQDKYLLRQLIKISTGLIDESYDESKDARHLIDAAEQEVFNIRQANATTGFVSMADMVENSIDTIETLCNQEGKVSGISTGFRDLDKILSGLHSGNLVVVAGRPSMGKTSFGLNIARHIGLNKKVPVGIFSLEMSMKDLMMRMLCSEAKVESSRVRDGYIGKGEWASLTTAAGKIKESRIFIDDTPSITPMEMKARARRLKAEHPDLALIVVDYLQLMPGEPGSGYDNRQQEITFISRSLKILAKEIDVPVMALSQLSRAPEKRSGDSRPRLSDIRESGAIEQDADVVLFLFRPSYYKNQAEVMPEEENIAKVIIGKQRNGPTGEIEMVFQKEYTQFKDLARREEF
ncbi:MAG: replicative DNA helicase [Elusimicrobiota bacterium]|nr:replicative DNA helicase [Elusimicrobiota bacterium]